MDAPLSQVRMYLPLLSLDTTFNDRKRDRRQENGPFPGQLMQGSSVVAIFTLCQSFSLVYIQLFLGMPGP